MTKAPDTIALAATRRGGRQGLVSVLSFFEMVLYLALLAFMVKVKTGFYAPDVTAAQSAYFLLSDPLVLGPAGLSLFSFFSLLLTARTPLVNFALVRGMSVQLPPEMSLSVLDRRIDAGGFQGAKRAALEAARQTFKEQRDTDQERAWDLASEALLNAFLEKVPERDTAAEFRDYLFRSRIAAETAQRRPNALLFIGTIIALVGLGFFFVTLPGSEGGQAPPHDFWSSGLQLLPRLLMLVFIQVLAGFFLKQYRASMEDFRYYESVLRHRETQYLSYMLRKNSGDKEAIIGFATEIMEDRQLGLLTKGQTTEVLEAQRLASNEFASFFEKLAELAAGAKDKATDAAKKATGAKKGGGANPKPKPVDDDVGG